MGFEPLGKTIKSLLSDHTQFNIPRFQRDFSWDKQNYEEFYNDIIAQIIYIDNSFISDKYFLGNMILLGNKNSDEVDVIDGQQRLTTITIFLAALRDKLLLTKDERATDIAETIQNEYILKKIDGKTYRRLEPKSSFPYFANTIQDHGNVKQDPTSGEEEDIEKTFNQFLSMLSFEHVSKLFDSKFDIKIDDNRYIEALKVIRDQILVCEVVSIYADDKLQANKIFENINSKGKPLNQVDLIKNYIFNALPISNAGVDNTQDFWNSMKKKLSTNSNTENSNFSISFEDFFTDYIKAKYPKIKANRKNVYEKFRKEFSNPEKIEIFMENIINDIDVYISMINPKQEEFARQEKQPIYYALQAINRFKGKQVRIPILSLLIKKKEHNNMIKNAELINVMQFLANFHFAVFGTNMKFRSNLASKPFNDFTIDIFEAQSKIEINTAINSLKSSLLELLKKETFIEYFVELTFDKKHARKGQTEFPTSYALNTIENKLNSSLVNKNNSSIEHIIDESESGEKNIGNLTVLENYLNTEIDKKKKESGCMLSYEQKLDYYVKSDCKMIKRMINEYSTFNVSNIENRAIQLAEYFFDNVLNS